MTQVRRLIFELTEMDAQLGFLKSLESELEIDRRVVNGIAADDHKQLDTSVIDVVNQFF